MTDPRPSGIIPAAVRLSRWQAEERRPNLEQFDQRRMRGFGIGFERDHPGWKPIYTIGLGGQPEVDPQVRRCRLGGKNAVQRWDIVGNAMGIGHCVLFAESQPFQFFIAARVGTPGEPGAPWLASAGRAELAHFELAVEQTTSGAQFQGWHHLVQSTLCRLDREFR